MLRESTQQHVVADYAESVLDSRNYHQLFSPYSSTDELICCLGDVDHGSANDDQPAANNIDSTGYVHHCTTNNHNSTGRLSLLLLVITREEQEHFV